jgi:hypothetical protein
LSALLEWGFSIGADQNDGVRERLIQVGLGLALAVAAVAMYLAFTTGRDETAPEVRRGGVLRVFPQPDTVALRQDAIGVDLAFGYRAALTLDRRPIPDDQLDIVEGINRVSFTPGTGKEIEQLDEGRHCATVEYFVPAEVSGDRDTYTWCFSAA